MYVEATILVIGVRCKVGLRLYPHHRRMDSQCVVLADGGVDEETSGAPRLDGLVVDHFDAQSGETVWFEMSKMGTQLCFAASHGFGRVWGQ